jgi:citrate lyase subunit beta/citryl-CoA lyase
MAFVDLEDSVPAALKNDETRARVVQALVEHPWRAPTLAVRVNPIESEWCERDLIVVVVEGAGPRVDCVVIPKAEDAAQVETVDRLLSELEATLGLERPIGLEAQIESARGLVEVERIAAASPRLETLVFGPGDYAA